MRSLRSRLVALWLMLLASGLVTGFLLLEFYRQSASAQVGRAEETVARTCRDLADRYQFFVSGWTGGSIDEHLKQQFSASILERLFEPFVTGRADGTGLGLAVVREIARAHGVEARYVPTAQGAVFEIEVPWRPS